MSPSDLAWLNLWELFATVGFVLVIVGVVIEGVEHFVRFSKTKIESARKLKIEKLGWLILVAGLAIEFLGEHQAKRIADRDNARLKKEAGDAINQASDANALAARSVERTDELRLELAKTEQLLEQTRNIASSANRKAEDLNPLKQPIRTVTAFATFSTGSTDGPIGRNERIAYAYPADLSFGPTTLSGNVRLVAYEYKAWGSTSNGWDCLVEFHMDPDMPSRFGLNVNSSVEAFRAEVKLFRLTAYFLPPRTEIKHGELNLIINSSINLRAPIEPQKVDLGFVCITGSIDFTNSPP